MHARRRAHGAATPGCNPAPPGCNPAPPGCSPAPPGCSPGQLATSHLHREELGAAEEAHDAGARRLEQLVALRPGALLGAQREEGGEHAAARRFLGAVEGGELAHARLGLGLGLGLGL